MGRKDIFGVESRDFGRGKRLVMFRDSALYNHMKILSKGERAVLDFILQEMEEDLNTVIVSGDARDRCIESTGLSSGTISNILVTLKAEGFIDKTKLPYEYVVHPTLAVSGDERAVYKSFERFEKELKDEV